MAEVRYVAPHLRPLVARALLVAGLGLLLLGLLTAPPSGGTALGGPGGGDDVGLYAAVVERVRAGEAYYDVVGEELRQRGFAVRPFVNWRLPTVAVGLGLLPDLATGRLVFGVLALAALGVSLSIVPAVGLGPRARIGAGVLLVLSMATALADVAVLFHEAWAAVLIVASLALRVRGATAAAVALGLAALAVRELAVLYVGAMAVVAWGEGHRREAGAWFAVLGVFGAGLAVHAGVVDARLRPDDPAKTWVAGGGWAFVVSTARWNPLLLAAPRWVAAIAWPAAWLGAAGLGGPLGVRVAVILGVYGAAYAVVGNPHNDYWGLVYAPLLAWGLAAAPGSIAGLLRAARGISPSSSPGSST